MRISKPLAAVVLALVASARAARAETVDVTSTTMLRLEQQTRGGQPLQEPELVDVAPIFEVLSISARDVRNPIADDLTLVAQTWGSVDLGELRWDNGTSSDFTGDVAALDVQGKFANRHLLVRATIPGRGASWRSSTPCPSSPCCSPARVASRSTPGWGRCGRPTRAAALASPTGVPGASRA